MANFVLVHGAWHGGWCWKWLKEILEADGHQVYTPTLTGLGERKHLMRETVTMDIMVEDICNVFEFEDLYDVVLVGHSFGGCVVTGVADRMSNRIKKLIYLDAAVPEDGHSMLTSMPIKMAEERIQQAQKDSGGVFLNIPSPELMGIVDEKQWEFVKRSLVVHPFSSYKTSVSLKKLPGEGISTSYIVCTNPGFAPLEWARQRAKKYGWPIYELNTGHDAMVTDPKALSELLIEISLK